MFIPCSEKQGTAYFEFQYCKKEWTTKKLIKKGFSYWEKDSLLVHIDNDKEFLDNYEVYLQFPTVPKGKGDFDFCSSNYYTKEQTLLILDQIKNDKPKEFETLVAWLEKATTDYNGFFFLGI